MTKYSEKYLSNIKINFKDETLSKKMQVFFNKEMYFNRLTTFFLIKKEQPKKIIDLMSATGILSIAIKKDLNLNIIANDINPTAIKTIKENAKLNNIKLKTTKENAEEYSKQADFFIIDPFGVKQNTFSWNM